MTEGNVEPAQARREMEAEAANDERRSLVEFDFADVRVEVDAEGRETGKESLRAVSSVEVEA